MDVQHRDRTLWAVVGGELDESGGAALGRVLERDGGFERVLMLDLHGVTLMNREGLLHLLDLHHRAECHGLRVLVVGWQAQPQQVMADLAGIPGRHAATGERYTLPGFRRLLEERVHQARDLTATDETAPTGPAG
ncbi:STAS domain-containing protein [Streptomyces sp. NPDC001568]|uniref:STAS domain-containing protein n=1 Tax=Streptomyces sp. NPDC001568 TaxID=3364588 RepID=UPI0036B3FB5B